MLGAIIGDMAAWTWQHEKSSFYKKLLSDHAPISEYGATILAMSKPLFENQRISFDTLESQLFPYLWYGCDICQDVEEWVKNRMKAVPFNKVRLIANMMNAIAGWSAETADNAKEQARMICVDLQLEKEDYYAAWTLPRLIWGLRQGLTKDEALQSIKDFGGDIVVDWKYQQHDSPMTAIARAWDAFYRSFDFTSAIHSAVKSPINPRLTAAIAGELAEAMYGCGQGILKKKYAEEDFVFKIRLPRYIEEKYRSELEFIRRNRKVFFFQKNNARTNVERHHWTPVESKFEGKAMTKEYYNVLKEAFYTDWDRRYGFYLDDGWFYVYRSFVLICRFKVMQEDSNKYVVGNIQKGDEDKCHEIALEEAFSSLSSRFYREKDKEDVNPKPEHTQLTKTIQTLADRRAQQMGYLCASYMGRKGDMFVFSPRHTDNVPRTTGLPCVIWVENGEVSSAQDFFSFDIMHGIRMRGYKKGKRLYEEMKQDMENPDCSHLDKEYLLPIIHCIDGGLSIYKDELYDYLEIADRLNMRLVVRKKGYNNYGCDYLELLSEEAWIKENSDKAKHQL